MSGLRAAFLLGQTANSWALQCAVASGHPGESLPSGATWLPSGILMHGLTPLWGHQGPLFPPTQPHMGQGSPQARGLQTVLGRGSQPRGPGHWPWCSVLREAAHACAPRGLVGWPAQPWLWGWGCAVGHAHTRLSLLCQEAGCVLGKGQSSSSRSQPWIRVGVQSVPKHLGSLGRAVRPCELVRPPQSIWQPWGCWCPDAVSSAGGGVSHWEFFYGTGRWLRVLCPCSRVRG